MRCNQDGDYEEGVEDYGEEEEAVCFGGRRVSGGGWLCWRWGCERWGGVCLELDVVVVAGGR